MLIEFRVANHRSLLDEQVLTLEAAKIGAPGDRTPREVKGHSERLLPAIAIYGANASGKSNVLNALAFMKEAVASSSRQWEPEEEIPRSPFAWGDAKTSPSIFEAIFLIDGVKYQYGFALNDSVIEEEWLDAWPEGRRQNWFSRDFDEFQFGSHLAGPNKVIKETTKSNSLFLSSAAQQNHERLTPIYLWFRRILPVNIIGQRLPAWLSARNSFFRAFDSTPSLFHEEETEMLSKLLQLLKAADFGICDVKMVDDTKTRRPPWMQFMLKHQPDDENSWLELNEESSGTKTLFRIAPAIFHALETGGVLLIDELEDSLHPLLGLAIVNLFNSPDLNPNNAQLVFTTHDTNLLGTISGGPAFRRDQIWFTEKARNGSTSLYPLTDYKPRNSENLERGYLQGRYGAIPFLGNLHKIVE